MEDVDKKYKNVFKFYVTDGIAEVNGQQIPVDPKISVFPCLIDGTNYYMTVDPILEHLEKSGEINATAN